MTHVTCRLTAKNRDRLRNPTLGNRVWATFTFITTRGRWQGTGDHGLTSSAHWKAPTACLLRPLFSVTAGRKLMSRRSSDPDDDRAGAGAVDTGWLQSVDDLQGLGAARWASTIDDETSASSRRAAARALGIAVGGPDSDTRDSRRTFEENVREGSTLIFLDIPEYPHNTAYRMGRKKPPCHNQLDPRIRFDRTPTCNGRTDGHGAIASTRASL